MLSTWYKLNVSSFRYAAATFSFTLLPVFLCFCYFVLSTLSQYNSCFHSFAAQVNPTELNDKLTLWHSPRCASAVHISLNRVYEVILLFVTQFTRWNIKLIQSHCYGISHFPFLYESVTNSCMSGWIRPDYRHFKHYELLWDKQFHWKLS